MRFPEQLHRRVPLQARGDGTYDLPWGVATVRVVVLNEVPPAPRNAVWNLFSGQAVLVQAAQEVLRPRLATMSSVLNLLWEYYGLEGVPMTYTLEDLERELAQTYERWESLEAIAAG